MLNLLSEIEAFLSRTSISPSYFGKLAVNDGKLVDRLRNGGDVTTTTDAAVRKFMSSYESKAA